jgi:formylglycine-generating enzyme required for sulfatase activity
MRLAEPSPVGIYPLDTHEHRVRDLAGNVWEWCSDLFGVDPVSRATSAGRPIDGSFRVLRGGSFHDGVRPLRAVRRTKIESDVQLDNVGFRVVWWSA